MLKQGQMVPNFELLGNDNKMHSLNHYLGKNVVVYFYPKDDTPGCTKEACDFRDNINELKMNDTVVFGISKDSINSHNKFIEKHKLNFTLLSDPDLEVYKLFGAMDEGKTNRATFLIDKKGKIAKIWSPVKVPGHVEEVIDALESLDKT